LNGDLGNSLTSSDSSPASQPGTATGGEPRSAIPARREGTFASSATVDNFAYRIGPFDVLDVSVFNVPELSKTVQVANAGTVNLPLVGDIPAAGKTPQEVERELTQRLGAKYLNSPQVTVFVREYNSQKVTVEGAVKSPGQHSIIGQSSLVRMIATAGGMTDNYNSTVVVFRETGGQRMAARFDIDDIRAGKAQDPALQAGDVVIVGTSAIKTTYNNLLKALPVAGLFVTLL